MTTVLTPVADAAPAAQPTGLLWWAIDYHGERDEFLGHVLAASKEAAENTGRNRSATLETFLDYIDWLNVSYHAYAECYGEEEAKARLY